MIVDGLVTLGVATLVVAWVEITTGMIGFHIAGVATLVVAWVEIDGEIPAYTFEKSPL